LAGPPRRRHANGRPARAAAVSRYADEQCRPSEAPPTEIAARHPHAATLPPTCSKPTEVVRTINHVKSGVGFTPNTGTTTTAGSVPISLYTVEEITSTLTPASVVQISPRPDRAADTTRVTSESLCPDHGRSRCASTSTHFVSCKRPRHLTHGVVRRETNAEHVSVCGEEIKLIWDGGDVAGIDFGGRGRDVLLVHGSGHNSAAWIKVAAHLVEHCHLVAIDMRGHGQTTTDSTNAEQYWRDLGPICDQFNLTHPVVVGHSTGGYAVTAATAAGLLNASGICVIDGFVLDARDAAAAGLDRARSAETMDQLWTAFRYGWRADDRHKQQFIDRVVSAVGTDWLNSGADPEQVREVTTRSFLHVDHYWLRRPTLEEIGVVAQPDPVATVYPSVDVYERIDRPLSLVLASDGFYAQRHSELGALVEAHPERTMVQVKSNHNVPMTHPRETANAVLSLLRRTAF
jgi:pimeloyl-ACP methyl ester carboxylesterase